MRAEENPAVLPMGCFWLRVWEARKYERIGLSWKKYSTAHGAVGTAVRLL